MVNQDVGTNGRTELKEILVKAGQYAHDVDELTDSSLHPKTASFQGYSKGYQDGQNEAFAIIHTLFQRITNIEKILYQNALHSTVVIQTEVSLFNERYQFELKNQPSTSHNPVWTAIPDMFEGTIIEHSPAKERYGGVAVNTPFGNFSIAEEHQVWAANAIGMTVNCEPIKSSYASVRIKEAIVDMENSQN